MTAPGPQFCSVDWAGRPVEIEHQWVEAGPASGPLLVFLHEGLGSVSMWRDFPARVCERLGWQGLVYSRPGYGRSTPRAPDEAWGADFMHQQAHEVLPALLAALGIAAALLISLNLHGEEPLPAGETLQSTPELIQRGEYLARVGNCMACHTAQGGAPWAGGRGIETPFGVIYSPNLTPDQATGLGAWTSAEFWRALHHGRSKDGRLLYPAFPYPSYTHVTREDSDALYAYLQSLPPVALPSAIMAVRASAVALRTGFMDVSFLSGWRKSVKGEVSCARAP